MSEVVDSTRHPELGSRSSLRVAAGAVSFLSVMAVAATAVVPAVARAAGQPPLRTALSAVCLCAVGMTVGILGSRGMTSPRRSVRVVWNGAALVGLAATCIWATPSVAALGVNGKVLATILWAATAVATFVVVGSSDSAATPVVRTWALAAPWLLLAFTGLLAAGVAASFDAAATVLSTAVLVVAIGAVALVPGLLVRESVESLRGEGFASRLLAGPRAARGVWVVLVVKTVVTLGTVLLGVWRWKVLPDARSWISGTGAVLLLVTVLALDHRFPVFRRNDARVSSGVGLVVAVPLVVVVAGAMLLLTVETVVRSPGPLVALVLLVVAVVALRRTWGRQSRWGVLVATMAVGVACGLVAVASVRPLSSGSPINLTGPFLTWGVVIILAVFAVGVVAVVAVALVRRRWRLPVLVAALTVWVLWSSLVGGPQRGWTTNLLLSLALLYALVLHARGRQNLVDAGELLRFGLASLVVVDLPYLFLVLPDAVAPWVLALGLGGPGVALAVGVARGTIRLRAVALVGAVFGPLLAARLMTQSMPGGDLAETLEGLVSLLMGVFGLPLAALISTASAQPNSPDPVTTGQHAG